jgi:hypothetical protein
MAVTFKTSSSTIDGVSNTVARFSPPSCSPEATAALSNGESAAPATSYSTNIISLVVVPERVAVMRPRFGPVEASAA